MENKGISIEYAKFKLKTGFTDGNFIEAENGVRNGMIKSMAGYISRELSKDEDNRHAIRYQRGFGGLDGALKQDPSMKTYGSMIDFSSMRTEIFDNIL